MSEEWVVVARFGQLDDRAKLEFNRWYDIAEDLALLPEHNVRLVEDESGVRVEVSRYINSYYQGEAAL